MSATTSGTTERHEQAKGSTYWSMQVDEPGAPFHPTEKEIAAPGAGYARVTVEAVGVCHSDALFIDGHMPGVTFPLVTGHEIAGRIDALGDGVADFEVGQRVAVGWFGGNCGHCVACREGDAINCAHLQTPGLSYPGGFAETIVVPASALARIPAAFTAAGQPVRADRRRPQGVRPRLGHVARD